MNILFHNYHEELNDNNRLFDHRNTVIGDDLLRPFQVLKEEAAKHGIMVGTSSVISLDQADAIVFVDFPNTALQHVKRMINTNKPLYLIVLESILIRPLNKSNDLFSRFKKIFTYDDLCVDNDRIFKINYSYDLPKMIQMDLKAKYKLCVMIAGNKHVDHPQELYSKRINTIRWFENNHPDDFDLYGIGWDEYNFGNKLPMRILNRYKKFKKFFAPCYPSYQGVVERKRPVLERYRFTICYENVRDVPGYITEKIFDCFFAGSVPVYWGAPNVADYIPVDCFIDRKKFGNHESLYNFLTTMSDINYMKYLNNISNYLSSSKASSFSVECFASDIITGIMNE